MKNKGTPTDDNTIKTITYSIVGGSICLTLMPGYIPYVICYSGIIGSLYGISKILQKNKDAEEMNFISKENIKYFNNDK